MAQHTSFVIPAARFATVVAALTVSVQPAFAQQDPSPPKPTVGEASSPRQDGTTRPGVPRPAPGHRKGTSTTRGSDSDNILGTPK